MDKENMKSVRWAFNFNEWRCNADEWAKAMKSVEFVERQRIRKFRYSEDAKSALSVRLLMNQFALKTLKIPKEDLKFGRTEKGRPKLGADLAREWDFNASHQGSFSVFAAEKGAKVGVDVMRLEDKGRRDKPKFLNLMKRKFTAEEWSQIGDDLRTFYRFWCLKESFVKAEGSGLSWDLQRISFDVKDDLERGRTKVTSLMKLDGKAMDNWTFEESLLGGDHCVCVASDRNGVAEGRRFEVIEDIQIASFDRRHDEDDLSEDREKAIFNQMCPNKPF